MQIIASYIQLIVIGNSYSLASPELMRAFVQINLSQFAVRSCGERSHLQQGDDSQISYLFSYFNLFNP